MAEIAALKELQAGLNASFQAVYDAQDAKSMAKAKESLVGLSHATAGAALGPVLSVLGFVGQVCLYCIDHSNQLSSTSARTEY